MRDAELARDARHKIAELFTEDGAEWGGSIDFKVDCLLRDLMRSSGRAELVELCETLADTLESVLAGKSVRDADEVISIARSTIKLFS